MNENLGNFCDSAGITTARVKEACNFTHIIDPININKGVISELYEKGSIISANTWVFSVFNINIINCSISDVCTLRTKNKAYLLYSPETTERFKT